MDLLTKLSQLQIKPEQRLSELTYQVSETLEEENILLTTSELNELMGQLKELKIRRGNVAKLLDSVSNSSDEMEVALKKRKTVLQENQNKNQETKSSDSNDGDKNMEVSET